MPVQLAAIALAVCSSLFFTLSTLLVFDLFGRYVCLGKTARAAKLSHSLCLRASRADESQGIDDTEVGEFAVRFGHAWL